MENKQKINCTVETCKYNNINECECMLKQINVLPKKDCKSGLADESMCGSYKHDNI